MVIKIIELIIIVKVLIKDERTMTENVANKTIVKAARVDILPDGNGLLGRSLLSTLISK